MRCSRPAVPGMAHGRARVSSSRRYGQNSASSPAPWLRAVANPGSISGSSSSSGIRHGSEPLAIMPSESSITGVR